jgi:hypothetical protein
VKHLREQSTKHTPLQRDVPAVQRVNIGDEADKSEQAVSNGKSSQNACALSLSGPKDPERAMALLEAAAVLPWENQDAQFWLAK